MCLVNSFLSFRPSFLHFLKHASRLTLLTVLTSCSIRSIKTVSTTSQQRSTQTIRFRTYVSLKQVNALYRLQCSRTSSRRHAKFLLKLCATRRRRAAKETTLHTERKIPSTCSYLGRRVCSKNSVFITFSGIKNSVRL